MNIRKAWFFLSGCAVCGAFAVALLVAALPALAQEKQDTGVRKASAMPPQISAQARKDLVLKGDAVCTRCHDEEDSPGVLTIGRTKHGTRADSRTPTCTTCHGDSEAHLRKIEGKAVRPKPDLYYSKGTHTPAEVRNDTCLNCHKGSERMFWSMSTHAARGNTCASCHQVHNGGVDKVRARKTQAEVCFGCHKKQRVAAHKPSRHPTLEGKVVCSDCHNPHGSAGPKMMKRDTVVDTCYQCHAEKRGPFLWEHQPVTEDCSLCHDPHGTTTASLLKWRIPFLCQQCHEPDSHRGNPPSVAPSLSTNLGGITLGRGCVNCHVNIHGGNSAENDSSARSLRK